jgi:hypothetical protein
MFERALIALRARVQLKVSDLLTAPSFFEFIYSVVSDYEGHEEIAQEGRYFVFPNRWVSSFGEMYSSLAGHVVDDLIVAEDGTAILRLADGIVCHFTGDRVEFGPEGKHNLRGLATPICLKNFDGTPCTLDFIKTLVIGARVTSAGDFGDYVEFGLDERFNLGLRVGGFHVVSTENPVDEHRL